MKIGIMFEKRKQLALRPRTAETISVERTRELIMSVNKRDRKEMNCCRIDTCTSILEKARLSLLTCILRARNREYVFDGDASKVRLKRCQKTTTNPQKGMPL